MFFLRLLRWLLPLGFILWLSPEKIEKAVPLFWGWLSPRGTAVIVCVWTDIWFGHRSPLLLGTFLFFVRRRAVGAVGCFIVRRRKLCGYRTVLEVHAIHFFEIADGRIHGLDLRVVTALKGMGFLYYFRGDRRGNFTAGLTSLDNDSQGEFWMIIRSKS